MTGKMTTTASHPFGEGRKPSGMVAEPSARCLSGCDLPCLRPRRGATSRETVQSRQPQSVLIRTKWFPPPLRAGWVGRARLSTALSEGTQLPVTLISAGAGFGKTSLVAEWVHARRMPVAWVSLDAADSDPMRFWGHVCGALGGAVASNVERFARIGQACGDDLEALVTAIVNVLAARSQPVALVLDDLHVVESRRIHESLEVLLAHCPPALRLIVTTRQDPPWPLSRLRARGQLAEIRSRDLRFSRDEAMQLLRGVVGQRLADRDCERLRERTEGWVVGLHLAALSLKSTENVDRFVEAFSGSHRFVLDYLAHEVLAQQDDETQRFLLQSAVLGSLCAELCDAVLQIDDSSRILRTLDAKNLFLIPLDDTQSWYRYHHLLRDYLRSRLAAEAVDSRPLHRRASVWLERAGHSEEAIDHALDAGDHQRAASLIERSVEARFTVQRQVRTLEWLERLPLEVVSARPQLSSVQIWAAFVIGKLGEASERLERAVAALDTAHLTDVERRSAGQRYRVYAAWLAYKLGEEERCIQLASEVVEELGEEPSRLRGLALLALARGQLYAERFAEARASCDRVLSLAADGTDPINVQVALSMAALAEVLQGNWLQVTRDYDRAMAALGGDRGPAHLAAGLIRLCMGEALRALGQLERAERLLREGLQQCQRQLGLPEHVCKGKLALARVRLARADRAEAEALLRQADRVAEEVRRKGPCCERLLMPALRYRRDLLRELAVAASAAAEPGPVAAGGEPPAPLSAAPPEPAAQGSVGPAGEPLSDRERGLLRLMSGGLSNSEIAAELYLSVHTVKWHARRLYDKLGVKTRGQAVAAARQRRLI